MEKQTTLATDREAELKEARSKLAELEKEQGFLSQALQFPDSVFDDPESDEEDRVAGRKSGRRSHSSRGNSLFYALIRTEDLPSPESRRDLSSKGMLVMHLTQWREEIVTLRRQLKKTVSDASKVETQDGAGRGDWCRVGC